MQLARWADEAERVATNQALETRLAAAHEWCTKAATAMRNDRLDPIRERARQLWELVRAQSNVALREICFEGRGNQRRVEFDVAVDGTGSQALGVMSQGELNALALAVFLRRATSVESPFRFVVIDDPVQAMDPSKVEGLARVLQKVARDRQVIVFTHDRLVDALHDLRTRRRCSSSSHVRGQS